MPSTRGEHRRVVAALTVRRIVRRTMPSVTVSAAVGKCLIYRTNVGRRGVIATMWSRLTIANLPGAPAVTAMPVRKEKIGFGVPVVKLTKRVALPGPLSAHRTMRCVDVSAPTAACPNYPMGVHRLAVNAARPNVPPMTRSVTASA